MIGRTHHGQECLIIHTCCPLFKPEPHARTMKKEGLEGGISRTLSVPFPVWPHWINPCQLSLLLTCLIVLLWVGGWLKPNHQDYWGLVSCPNNLEITHIDLIGEAQIRLGSLATPAEVHYLATLLAFLLHEYSLFMNHSQSAHIQKWMARASLPIMEELSVDKKYWISRVVREMYRRKFSAVKKP